MNKKKQERLQKRFVKGIQVGLSKEEKNKK